MWLSPHCCHARNPTVLRSSVWKSLVTQLSVQVTSGDLASHANSAANCLPRAHLFASWGLLAFPIHTMSLLDGMLSGVLNFNLWGEEGCDSTTIKFSL